MNLFEYAVRLTEAEEGGFVVTCRDFPEVITQGDTLEDALMEAADAMDEAFANRMENDMEIPVPSRPENGEHLVAPPPETVLKASLHVAMRKAKITKVELARRINVDEKEVRRMLDPHHKSKFPRMVSAIGALGEKLVIGLG